MGPPVDTDGDPNGGLQAQVVRALQWGRRWIPTETCVIASWRARIGALQWGRRWIPTETRGRDRGERGGVITSMGPPVDTDGDSRSHSPSMLPT